ncbi:hypothetical protein JCM5350_005582 [Sporobolomyces pararoseus]
MATAILDNSQEQGSSFESLFIRFDGLQAGGYPQELTRDAQNLEIAAGQPWENAIAELREELDLPVERFKLTLHRLRGGQKWRIAKSAWGGIKSEEELYLVAAPINTEEDRKPKDEPKPKPSPPLPGLTSKQPISPESLARSASDGRRSLNPDNRRTPSQDLVVPATPEDSTISDTEDEAMPLDGEDEEEASSGIVEEGTIGGVTTLQDRRLEESEILSGLRIAQLNPPVPPHPESSQVPPPTNGAAAFDPLPSLTSQTSTGSIEEENRRDLRRSVSPSPSHRSTKLGILQQHSSFGSPPPFQRRSSTPPPIKAPPSSAPSLLPEQSATPIASTSSFRPPAQPLHRPTGGTEPISSQPSDLSDVSFRIGIDSSGQVNFVPASSPQVTSQQLPRLTTTASENQQSIGVEERERKISDKGKGKAVETPSSEEEEEVVLVRSPRVKGEPRSSPRQNPTTKSSPTRPHTSIPSFTDEIVSPPKRQLKCRIAPRKKRRLTDSIVAADTSNSTIFTEQSTSSHSSSQTSTSSSAPRLPSSLESASHPPPPSTCHCQTQQISSSSRHQNDPPARKKPRSSLSLKQKKLEDDALALARPRVEIPPFPSSGRFCLYLRLPNVPVAPKWAGPRLKPLFLLKYQGNGSSTLGNVLSHVFRFVSNETGWNVKDLRLRYTDLSEDEGSEEREKYAWGFDTLLTDFQNLEEWRVGTQDFLDVDYIPFSSSRTWMDTE